MKIEKSNNTAPKKVKESMSYFIVYEHVLAGQVRKGNVILNLNEQVEIEDANSIAAIENYLLQAGKVSAVVIDYKPIKMVKVV